MEMDYDWFMGIFWSTLPKTRNMQLIHILNFQLSVFVLILVFVLVWFLRAK